VLGDVLRTDPDADVRAEALRRLVGLAAETADAGVARDVVAQLVEGGHSRELVVVARDSAAADVKAVVVEALTDSRALGAISRQATDGPTRLLALSRLSDSDELCQVALRSEYTDSAVGALGRLIDPSSIAAVAQRARNKVAMRKARARERLLEEALRAVPPPATQSATMSLEDRQRARVAGRGGRRPGRGEDPAIVEASVTRLRVAWAELQADTDVDVTLQERFDNALESIREATAARAAERQAEEDRQREREQEAADRVAVCEAIETLVGDGALDRFAELKVRWDGLPPLTGDYSATLTRRFQDACRRFEERERRRGLAAVAAERLDTLPPSSNSW
jgi:hypothetical protein